MLFGGDCVILLPQKSGIRLKIILGSTAFHPPPLRSGPEPSPKRNVARQSGSTRI